MDQQKTHQGLKKALLKCWFPDDPPLNSLGFSTRTEVPWFWVSGSDSTLDLRLEF